jgi:hypothetical protein
LRKEIVVISSTAKVPDLLASTSFGIEKELRLGCWTVAVDISSIPRKKAIRSYKM